MIDLRAAYDHIDRDMLFSVINIRTKSPILTSILKSLVEESGISFPIFVDSPLQKFDKDHSKNIIKKFYPSISKQVVLLPLLEKELTFDEFKMMESNVSALYKIINKNGNSKIVEFDNKSFLND